MQQICVNPRRILLIDDDPEYGSQLSERAKQFGIQVHAMPLPWLARSWDLVNAYDVLLVNYDLEEATGLEVAEFLDGRTTTPLVMVAPTAVPWDDRSPRTDNIRRVVSKWDGMDSVLAAALENV